MKPLKIIRSGEAIRDVADIHLFIATNNPAAADRFLDALRLSFRTLAQWPEVARATNPTAPDCPGCISGRCGGSRII